MNLLTKIAIVLVCFALCGAGTFIASTAQNEDTPQKTNVIPVKNGEVVRRVQIERGIHGLPPSQARSPSTELTVSTAGPCR